VRGHGKDGTGNLKAVIAAKAGEWPDTLTSISPSGSLHYYFNYPTGVVIRSNNTGKLAEGVDVIGEGGMVIVPPSIKPGVGAYRWFDKTKIADPPQWLVDCLKAEEHERRVIIDDDEIDIDKVIAALDAATNADVDEETWYHIMAAAHKGSGGDQRAFDAAVRWSKQSDKHDLKRSTEERWEAFNKKPARDINVGTLYWYADQTARGWRNDYMNKVFRDLQAKMQAARDAAKRNSNNDPSPEPDPGGDGAGGDDGGDGAGGDDGGDGAGGDDGDDGGDEPEPDDGRC
jgi:hypothetical protein